MKAIATGAAAATSAGESAFARKSGTEVLEATGFRSCVRTAASPLARAMTKTGAAAVGSALLSSLAAKVLATAAGPQAIAVFATLQQTRQAAVAVATANGQTALVRGASALEGLERREYIRTAGWIFLAATGAAALLLTAAPGWLMSYAAIPAAAARAVPLLALSVSLLSAFVFLSALLAAAGAIGRLAGSQVAGSAAMTAAVWPAAHSVNGGKLDALAHLLNFSSAASAGAGWWAVWRSRGSFQDWVRGPGRWWSARAARMFMSMSGALLVSGVAASATLLAVRARIIETQGAVVTGQFDAAWAISMSHATLVLGSMQSYYLPALSRTRLGPEKAGHISEVLTTSALVAAAVIAGLAVLKPWVLSALYASPFRPGARFLRWTLLGDYLKVASWIFSIPILARGDMKTFLAADLAAYASFAGGAVLFARWAGAAQGAAIGFAAMYVVHLAVCAGVVRWGYGIRIKKTAWGAFAAGMMVVAAASVFTWNQI